MFFSWNGHRYFLLIACCLLSTCCLGGGTTKQRQAKKTIHFSSTPALKGIPFADEQGIVLKYRRLRVSNVKQAFNPSIVKAQDGYLVVFRNEEGRGRGRKVSLAAARMDASFQQIAKTVILPSGQSIPQDPRCFSSNDTVYLLYSNVLGRTPYETSVVVAKLDPSTLHLLEEKEVQYRPQKIEKNWVPFVYKDSSGTDVYLVYSANPYKILRLARTLDGKVEEPFLQSNQRALTWESKWGKISGGTPALLVKDEYLSFFHSSFWSQGVRWYVMGAYTFAKEPPFPLRRISQYPIVFKEIYSTPEHPHVWFRPSYKMRVVFPGGFVESKEGEKDVIHLAFGENDSSLCVLTLDTEKLLDSLKDFQLQDPVFP